MKENKLGSKMKSFLSLPSNTGSEAPVHSERWHWSLDSPRSTLRTLLRCAMLMFKNTLKQGDKISDATFEDCVGLLQLHQISAQIKNFFNVFIPMNLRATTQLQFPHIFKFASRVFCWFNLHHRFHSLALYAESVASRTCLSLKTVLRIRYCKQHDKAVWNFKRCFRSCRLFSDAFLHEDFGYHERFQVEENVVKLSSKIRTKIFCFSIISWVVTSYGVFTKCAA